MAKLWFKARRYGWGWTPASIEGWAITALFLLLIVAGAAIFLYALRAGANAPLASLLFVLWTALLGGIATAIAWARGEPPRWRWGA